MSSIQIALKYLPGLISDIDLGKLELPEIEEMLTSHGPYRIVGMNGFGNLNITEFVGLNPHTSSEQKLYEIHDLYELLVAYPEDVDTIIGMYKNHNTISEIYYTLELQKLEVYHDRLR